MPYEYDDHGIKCLVSEGDRRPLEPNCQECGYSPNECKCDTFFPATYWDEKAERWIDVQDAPPSLDINKPNTGIFIEDTKGLNKEEVHRAIRDFLKERERIKICSKKRRDKRKAEAPPKQPKEPKPRPSRAGIPQKKYYVPTGRPRGRPRKVVPEVSPTLSSAEAKPLPDAS